MTDGPTVAVIGAGVAGIATAVKLVRAGFTEFTVFERSTGPGGTWLDNDYEGCEVDIPSYLYSYSFMPWVWSRTHATQPEILAYLRATIGRFGVGAHFRYRTSVASIVWSDRTRRWTVTLADGESAEFDAVISCVGFLNEPRYPDWPGLRDFAGPAFHTARWEHGHDLSGKRVAVVGTGSTATQVVPAIAGRVEHLYLFQREPGWVLPKGDRDYTPAERQRFARSSVRRVRERYTQYREVALVVKAWREGSELNLELRDRCVDYINSTIRSEDLRRRVTPSYPYACKRVVRSDSFYPALNRDNVTLVPHAVESVTPGAVVADGTAYDIDVLILGTGFHAQDYLSTVDVVGSGGRRLHDVWGDTARAMAGSTVPGFPNFFIVYGPNTNGGGSIIFQIERAADLAVRALRRVRRTSRPVDTRPAVFRRYVRWLDRTNQIRLSAQRHCNNYYHSASGTNVTQWPLTHGAFWRATLFWPLVGTKSLKERA